MQRTLTTCIFLYFGDTLVFVNKEWWQGSAPISCTLPHSLAHWRQVRRNYLFQGGYPRYHLICTPPRRGSPSWFPQSPGTVGYGPHQCINGSQSFLSRVLLMPLTSIKLTLLVVFRVASSKRSEASTSECVPAKLTF